VVSGTEVSEGSEVMPDPGGGASGVDTAGSRPEQDTMSNASVRTTSIRRGTRASDPE
jgi:hypothetical protein